MRCQWLGSWEHLMYSRLVKGLVMQAVQLQVLLVLLSVWDQRPRVHPYKWAMWVSAWGGKSLESTLGLCQQCWGMPVLQRCLCTAPNWQFYRLWKGLWCSLPGCRCGLQWWSLTCTIETSYWRRFPHNASSTEQCSWDFGNAPRQSGRSHCSLGWFRRCHWGLGM